MARGQQVQAAVESVNDKGIKINGEWVNYSNYFKGDKPQRGDRIVAEVDGRWLQRAQVVGSGRQGGSPSNGVTRGVTRTPSTDVMIARQVALKAATDFAKESGDTEQVLVAARDFLGFLLDAAPSDAPAEAVVFEDDDDLPF